MDGDYIWVRPAYLPLRHPQDSDTEFIELHRAELQHLQSSNRATAQKPRNMVDHTVTIQVDIESDDDQQPQNQHQQHQEGLNSAGKFHVKFGLLKLLIITHFRSLYIICQVIYLISLIEVTGPARPNWVYWYSYIVFGTLGFELLIWTNLSLVMWLAINMCLPMFTLASSGLLTRGSNWFLQLIQPFDDMPFSEVQLDF